DRILFSSGSVQNDRSHGAGIEIFRYGHLAGVHRYAESHPERFFQFGRNIGLLTVYGCCPRAWVGIAGERQDVGLAEKLKRRIGPPRFQLGRTGTHPWGPWAGRLALRRDLCRSLPGGAFTFFCPLGSTVGKAPAPEHDGEHRHPENPCRRGTVYVL